MRVFAVLLCAALVAAGCGSTDSTLDAKGEIRLDQTVIEFPRTFIGYPTTEYLVVRNTGFSTIPIEIALEGPFSMRSGRENVPGGGGLSLPITFVPSAPRIYEGRVLVTAEGVTHEVSIVAPAETPPPCVPSAPCRLVRFDPATGECHESVAPDFSACDSGNECLDNETCLGGACVGEAIDCDDGSVCTEDSCDPARGCIHRDVICPAPAEACLVAVCHPALGCTTANAPQGTVCGPVECSGAHLCDDGECHVFDVPDGTECTDACGDGQCRDGECERPDDVLELRWSYRPEDGARIVFGGISDGAGVLYWIENRGGQRTLVSALANGLVRYKEPLALTGAVGVRGVALEGGLLVVAAENRAEVEARLAADGSSPWLRDLRPAVEAEVDDCPCTVSGGSITRSVEGRALFAAMLRGNGETEDRRTFVAMLRTGSGEVAWTGVLAGKMAAAPIADEAGNLYLFLEHEDGGREFLSLDPAGEERWRVPAEEGAVPLAVWDGTVHQAIDTLRATADGAGRGALGYDTANAATPLHGPAGSWVFTREPDGEILARFFDGSGNPAPAIPLFGAPQTAQALRFTDPILTWRDTALVSTSVLDATRWTPKLLELKPDGEVRRSCDLDVEASVEGASSLRGEVWVVQVEVQGDRQLRAYYVPNGEPAARGWSGPLGNPAGGGRPQ